MNKIFTYAGEPVAFDSYLTSSQDNAFFSKHENESICCNCEFWDEHEAPSLDGKMTKLLDAVVIVYTGRCRRHSPVVVDCGCSGAWPETTYSEWCGDFSKVHPWKQSCDTPPNSLE